MCQVSLYLLLLEERYGQPLDIGVLWYLNDQARLIDQHHVAAFQTIVRAADDVI